MISGLAAWSPYFGNCEDKFPCPSKTSSLHERYSSPAKVQEVILSVIVNRLERERGRKEGRLVHLDLTLNLHLSPAFALVEPLSQNWSSSYMRNTDIGLKRFVFQFHCITIRKS
jgi:hypothetical protein